MIQNSPYETFSIAYNTIINSMATAIIIFYSFLNIFILEILPYFLDTGCRSCEHYKP